MRQSEAKDLRSFLQEPVEEIVVEGVKERSIDLQQDQLEDAHVGAQFSTPWVSNNSTPWDMLQDTGAPIQEAGIKFISGTNAQLPGTGVRFTTPWEGTGGQLHEVGARFTTPLGSSPLGSNPRTTDDFTLQQTMPIASIPDMANVGARFTTPLGSPPSASPSGSSLKPYRLQRYQSRGVPVSLSRSTSGTLRLRPTGERRVTADLAPAPHKIVPGEPSPALQSWERRRHALYTWLVLLLLFLLVVLGGIGLDSLIASYR